MAKQSEDWARLNYQPSVDDLVPLPVLEHVRSGSTVLDVGTNKGGNALFLAGHGFKVLGIDINEAAIETAKMRAQEAKLTESADFKVADVLEEPLIDLFNVVLLIRVLTCFPRYSDWRNLLGRIKMLVKPQGYLYVHDFLFLPENEAYRARYEAGARRGWRTGNFQVNDAKGKFLFIAHHHLAEEVASMMEEYESLHFSSHESLSMNGNRCQMFEFLGRRQT